jgi:hypothetical protein
MSFTHEQIVDAYQALGLPLGSPIERIRVEHKLLVQAWHPDRFSGSSRAQAEEKMKRINASVALLQSYLATNPPNTAHAQKEQAQKEQAKAQAEAQAQAKAQAEAQAKAKAEAKAKAHAEAMAAIFQGLSLKDLEKLSHPKKTKPQAEPCDQCFVPRAGITMTDTFRKFVRHLKVDHSLSMARIGNICGGVSETTLRKYETQGPTPPVCRSIRSWVKGA